MTTFQIVISILCVLVVIIYSVGLVLGLRWTVRRIRGEDAAYEKRKEKIRKDIAQFAGNRRAK